MPKSTIKPSIRINILKSQSTPEPLTSKFLKWLLSTGRFIIIFVEIVVLVAFVSRFKLDNDLANDKDEINKKIPIIESLRPDERIIRKTQLQLATIKSVRLNPPDYASILTKVALQEPAGVTVNTLSMESQNGIVTIKIVGSSLQNEDLSAFVEGLKSDDSFTNVNLDSVDVSQQTISFTISGQTVQKGI